MLNDDEFEKKLIISVCEKIKAYILTIKPNKKVFITFIEKLFRTSI